MSPKRISIRFNMANEDDRRAWELLHRKDVTLIGREIIRLIIDAEKQRSFEQLLRHIISDELSKILLDRTLEIQPTRTEQENTENEESILDFLDSL